MTTQTQTTFRIEIIRSTGRKVAKNPINRQPHQFDVREDAEGFANSMARTWTCDSKNHGLRSPKFQVFEVRA